MSLGINMFGQRTYIALMRFGNYKLASTMEEKLQKGYFVISIASREMP